MDAADWTAEQAFDAYEQVRHRLPSPAPVAGACRGIASLADLVADFDVFLLDAFGVLNIGETAIPGVVQRMQALRSAGKRLMVLTNAASFPTRDLVTKYRRLGYDFSASEVVSSRDALRAALPADDRRWGVMIPEGSALDDLPGLNLALLGDDPEVYADVDAFLLLGSATWTEARQHLLEQALSSRRRPLFVGNPDIVAPRERGFTIEPGQFAHRCADLAGLEPAFFGKPFGDIYDIAFSRLGQVSKKRVVMVGDSLHTDVLGARVAGVASVLITGWGFWAKATPAAAIRASGLAPDFLADRP